MRLANGVHRIDGVRGANAYLAETDEGLLVIDTGMPGNAERIVAFVRGLGHQPSEVRTIAITHSDPDHIGSVAALKALTGAKVAIGAADAPVLAGTQAGRTHGGLVGAAFLVLGPFLRVDPVKPDVLLAEGDVIAGYEVMATPGHSAGSLTLYRDGIVFCGDALLSDSKGNPRLPSKALSGDYDQALNSAAKIRELGYRVLLTGHGAPVFGALGTTAQGTA